MHICCVPLLQVGYSRTTNNTFYKNDEYHAPQQRMISCEGWCFTRSRQMVCPGLVPKTHNALYDIQNAELWHWFYIIDNWQLWY